MKIVAQSDFVQAEPASLSARLVARSVPDAHNPEHAWLSTLPIAAAIFKLNHSQAVRMAANKHFDALLHGVGRPLDLAPDDFAECIRMMEAEEKQTHFASWRSADLVNRCELEISIARFGAEYDLYLVSVVNRTEDAVNRTSLRRRTGFAVLSRAARG